MDGLIFYRLSCYGSQGTRAYPSCFGVHWILHLIARLTHRGIFTMGTLESPLHLYPNAHVFLWKVGGSWSAQRDPHGSTGGHAD